MAQEVILVFADTHFPYHHAKTFEFLEKVKKQYKPQKVFMLGDLLDMHAISYHESNPELLSAGGELTKSVKLIKRLAKIFPVMTLLQGNHDKLPIRKAKTAGLPNRFIRTNSEVFDMPLTWVWKFEERITMVDGRTLWMRHNLKKDALEVAKYYNTCFLQGHFHENLIVESLQDPKYNVFGGTVGCLVDDKSLAMEYNKMNLKRPQLGCVVIQNGIPKVITIESMEDKE